MSLPASPSERALAESNERYRSLFDYHPHAAFSLDPDGTFSDANAVARELSGYDLEELAAMSFADIICTEHLPRAKAAFRGALNREPQQLEATMWHRDGHVIEISVTVVPVVVGGVVVGVHGVAEDITERNDLRRALEQARRLALEASAAKSLFLANMSHEVRTPLTTVLGAAELLTEGGLTAGQERLLAMIHRAGERLLRLVNDILDFSRIEAGTVDLEWAPFDLHAVLTEVVEWATPIAQTHGLEFGARVDPVVPAKVCGDAMRLTQVLTNTIGNALKFTERGHVRLAVDVVGATAEAAEVRFVVEDTGIGIAGADLDRLFHSFTQVDPSATRRHGGAGLGLAISRELVALMGGTIAATSALGRGSVFTVSLPLALPRDDHCGRC